MYRAVVLLAALTLLACAEAVPGQEPAVTFEQGDGQLAIRIGGKPFASYVYNDAVIRRPYLAHVRTPAGVQVTRNHPPVAGQDSDDHATMHPGIWLAFGDVSGTDFWRNKGLVEHAGFVGKPDGGPGQGHFTVRNRYRSGDKVICEETCRIAVHVRPAGYLVVWDADFHGKERFTFGDQEEMGLGVRVATPLTVQNGGSIVNSAGRTNEKQVWGQPADWCRYEGRRDGRAVGVLLLPDPDNFRTSWFHVRDYGLMVANPFGRNALTGGAKSQVAVRPGAHFRLRFGALAYDGNVNAPQAYRDFLAVLGAAREPRK